MLTNIVEYFLTEGSVDHSTGVVVSLSLHLVISFFGILGTFAILISYAKGNDSTPHRMLIVSMIFADFLLCLNDLIKIPLHLGYGWKVPGIPAVISCIFDSTVLITCVMAEVGLYLLTKGSLV